VKTDHMKNTLLIDGDIVAYKACIYAQYEAEFEPKILLMMSDKEVIESYINAQFSEMIDVLNGGMLWVALSCPSIAYWRKKIMPSYKSNRSGSRPMGFWHARAYMKERYGATEVQPLEADDLLGIWATEPCSEHLDKVIVSEDKDLATVPGRFCRWPVDKQIIDISVDQARYNHLIQTLTGDTTDGYPGCPGVGPKTATKILAGEEGHSVQWACVLEAYELAFKKQGLGSFADSAISAWENASVAKILWADEFDFETGEVSLWPGLHRHQTCQPQQSSSSEETETITSLLSELSDLTACVESQDLPPSVS